MYELNTGNLENLQTGNPEVFTPQVLNDILELTTGPGDTTISFQNTAPDASGNVTVAAGTEVAYVTVPDGVDPTTLTLPPGVKVVIFQGSGGVSVVFNDTPVAPTTDQQADAFWPIPNTSVADRVVVVSAGRDKIVIGDSKNSLITGVGEGDTIVAGGGHDTIVAGTGHSTISGSTGHAVVKLSGHESDYVVVVNNGHAHVSNVVTHNTFVDISKIQYVQLDSSQALVFANNTNEAAVATMYQTVFGHSGSAAGIEASFAKLHAGSTLTQLADEFLKSAEYAALPVQNDETFINTLYLRTFGHYGDKPGIDTWVTSLQTHSRAEVVAAFDQIAASNLDGTMHTYEDIVGSVTIVHNIV